MAAKIISSLPSPFQTFESLSKHFTFLRIHGAYSLEEEKKYKYQYQLFSFVPAGGIYSQRSISNVNVEKILNYLDIKNDFIKAYNKCEGLGSIYLQVEATQLVELLK